MDVHHDSSLFHSDLYSIPFQPVFYSILTNILSFQHQLMLLSAHDANLRIDPHPWPVSPFLYRYTDLWRYVFTA